MPLKLKGVLIRHGIAQTDLASCVRQSTGRPMSHAAISLLINWGYWPRSTPAEDVRRQVEAFLTERKVRANELATIWIPIEGEDTLRKQQPVGSHLRALDAYSPYRERRPKTPSHEPLFEPMEVEMLSPQARKYFKLFRDPFQDDVSSLEDVFISADQRYISEAMYQTARHGGFVAVIGESGSGKTTLRRLLTERLRDQPIRMIFPQVLDKSRLSTGNICQAIVNDIAPGQKVRTSLEAQARQVRDILMSSSRADNNHVLVIEEAHDLSIQTIKYLKRFYEIEDGFRKLLSIILIGQPELKDKLDENRYPEAREVIRRIEIAELAPLDGNLEEYLALKFKRVGIDLPILFADDAYDAMRAKLTKTKPGTREVYSRLYPLIVNNLVTKAMNRAAAIGVPLVCGDLVKEL